MVAVVAGGAGGVDLVVVGVVVAHFVYNCFWPCVVWVDILETIVRYNSRRALAPLGQYADFVGLP